VLLDRFPIIVYSTWIGLNTLLFPFVVYKMLFNLEEYIPEVAANLVNKTE